MRWFRLYTDILDDPKMFELSDFQFTIFIKLMALASKMENGGRIDLQESAIKWSIHCQVPGQSLSKALLKLHQLGVISDSKPPFEFINWDKRQYTSEQKQQNRHRDKRENAGLPRNRWINPRIRAAVFIRDNNQCVNCGETENLTIDHIVSELRGGNNSEENLQVLCRACNAKKRDFPNELLKRESAKDIYLTSKGTRKAPISTDTDTETESDTEKDLKPLGHSSSNHDFFERFWSQYPRKEKKKNAVEAWARLKLTDEDFSLVMASLARQKMSDQWTRDGGKFIPHPTTWLNGRRWEDEGIQGDYATSAPGSPATKFEKNMAVLDEALKKAKGEGSNGGQGNGGERLEGVGNNLSRAERERGVRGNLPGASGGSAGRGSHKGGQGVPAAVPVLSDDSGDQGAGGADSSGVEP